MRGRQPHPAGAFGVELVEQRGIEQLLLGVELELVVFGVLGVELELGVVRVELRFVEQLVGIVVVQLESVFPLRAVARASASRLPASGHDAGAIIRALGGNAILDAVPRAKKHLVGLAVGATLVALAAIHVSCAACSRQVREKPRVAATVFPLYDLTRRLAEDRLDVQLILKPGLDVHGYEPRPRDVAGLAEADLIFAVGLALDPWAQALARSAGAGEARVFELGPLMDPILAPHGLIREEPLIDAHFWLDPVRAQRAVDVIVEALGGLDPVGGPFYRSRGQELKASFQAVHEQIAEHSRRWTKRRVVTMHGSLFYFSSRYGLEVVGVVEAVPGQEPPARHLAHLIDLLQAPDPPALFTESQLDATLGRALAREAGVTAHPIDPIGGTPDTDSYEKLLRRIAATMDEALR